MQIFMFNLQLPLARWMPRLSNALIKLCHELAFRQSVTIRA
jgi:hypothetical protein